MVMPLFKRGVPVQLVHMENLTFPDALKNTKVLIMSYADMKPMSATVQEQLTAWVKAGGVLVYYGKDDDPFQSVKEWWNTGENHYKTPLAHLLHMMNEQVSEDNALYLYGKGKMYVTREDPKDLVMKANADKGFMWQIQHAYEQDANAGKVEFKNSYRLDRGPYTLAAVMDENGDKSPLVIQGPIIDLYDPNLPILSSKTIEPGKQAFLYRVSGLNSKTPKVLSAASRVYNFKTTAKTVSFLTKSPSNTNNVMRVLLPSQPTNIMVTHNGKALQEAHDWDEATHTLLLKFENYADGVKVRMDK